MDDVVIIFFESYHRIFFLLLIESVESFGEYGNVKFLWQLIFMMIECIQRGSSDKFLKIAAFNGFDGFSEYLTQLIVTVFFGVFDSQNICLEQFCHYINDVVIFGQLCQVFQIVIIVFRSKENFKKELCPNNTMNWFFRSHSDRTHWEYFLLRWLRLAGVTFGLSKYW